MREDWDLQRIFLSVAELGSYSAAARALGASHTTISRRMSELESELQVKLFARTLEGVALTLDGERFEGHAREMAAAAARGYAAISPRPAAVRGCIRVSISETLVGYWLVRHLEGFRLSFPDLELEFVGRAWPVSLRNRSADVLVRLLGPGEENLVGRRISRVGAAFYAARTYVEARGAPAATADWAEHDILTYSPDAPELELANWTSRVSGKAPTRLRFSNHADILPAVREGLGIAALACFVGDAHDDLVRIGSGQWLGGTDMWLLAHPDLNQTPAVRAVLDFISSAALRDRALLRGRDIGS